MARVRCDRRVSDFAVVSPWRLVLPHFGFDDSRQIRPCIKFEDVFFSPDQSDSGLPQLNIRYLSTTIGYIEMAYAAFDLPCRIRRAANFPYPRILFLAEIPIQNHILTWLSKTNNGAFFVGVIAFRAVNINSSYAEVILKSIL